MRKFILLAALCCSVPLFAQSTSGPGNPNNLSPVPSCTVYKVYVDLNTGAQYTASGSPCAWGLASTPQTTVIGCTDGYDHLPCTVAFTSLSAQAANVSSTTLLASAPAGRYRIGCTVILTQAATTSSTTPACQGQWVDATTGILGGGSSSGTGTSNTVGSGSTATNLADVKASTAIQFQTFSYASSGATPMQYKVYVVLERVQ